MVLTITASLPMYPPASRVGAWLATHGCLAHLVACGHQVNVAPYFGEGWAYALDGVNVYPGAHLDDLPKPDVVISHLGDGQAGARWAEANRIPSVRMIHGLHPDNAPNLAVAPTALAVFNSVSLAEATDHDGPSIVVRPPIDPDMVRTVPGDRVTLVNLTSAKGGSVLFDLATAMPEVQFLGVRGGYGHQLSDKGKNLTLIDPTMDMAGDVYSRTRILLMPSAAETWGMVGLEAMCSGIPVIAHPTPGLRESLGDAGIFVDRGDLTGWADEIRRLMIPTEWAVASRIAREHADRFDPNADLTRFAEAITDVALVAA